MAKSTQQKKGAAREDSTRRTAEADAPRADAIDLGALPGSLGYMLRRAQLAVFKNFKRTFNGTDITPAQYSVLAIIARNPGLRQTQVSDALGIKRANFVALLDTLEARGLAHRAPATDRRSYALHLTARGKKLLKSLQVLSLEHEAHIGAPIGEAGREKLLALLNAVIAPLEEAGGDAGAGDDDM